MQKGTNKYQMHKDTKKKRQYVSLSLFTILRDLKELLIQKLQEVKLDLEHILTHTIKCLCFLFLVEIYILC